ncbi:MAG: hypothetical protein ABI543_12755 [Ignavibacteria bacterium]
MKKSEYSILFILSVIFLFLLLSGFSANQLYSQIPVPNCVCAECNKKCGTGHEKTCSSYSQKSTDSYKDPSEKSFSDIASLDGFNVIIDGGKILKVSNKNDFEVKYSFEFELTDKDRVTTIVCSNYFVKPNTSSLELFSATENAVLTKILITEAVRNNN